MTITLHEGDSRQVLREMIERGEFVDSCVCDPPYGLVSVTKRFGKEGAAPAKEGRDGLYARQSRGFMGQLWDGTQIERDPEFWKLVFAVMKPGAYIVAFSSSRTYGYMQVAMEQAGFITHPMIGWTFSSGFPKAHNASRAIDQALGLKGGKKATGEPVRRLRPGADQNKDGSWEKLDDREYQPGVYEPVSEEAIEWEGWHYGGQARKPAMEPIYVGQKPFSEKNGALNILKHGVGAVNIDGCRVPTDESTRRKGSADMGYHGGLSSESYLTGSDAGRWPANLIHDGSDEVIALFPDSAGQRGDLKSHGSPRQSPNGIYNGMRPALDHQARNDSGSAARFFESYPFEGKPIFHFPKANSKDRAGSKHPTVKPIALMRSLIRHVTPPGGRTLDPFAGSGTTGQAAREEGVGAVLIEREPQFANDIRRRLGLPSPTDSLFDDLLGEALPTYSTNSGLTADFEDLLG